MNIVIVGAGKLGQHVAHILAREKHNITLIDTSRERLQEASKESGIRTQHGSGTDWQLLDDLLEFSPNLFLSLTGSEETNLVACSIAKQLQYPRTIARIRDRRYLNRTRLDFGRLFDVDYFIGPEILVAQDILKYLINPGSLLVEYFAHGALQLRTLSIPYTWKREKTPLRELNLPAGVIVSLIKRDQLDERGGSHYSVIFPHGDDCILPGDEVTFIGIADTISEIHHFFGIEQREIRSIVIAGASLTGIQIAKELENRDIDVRIIEKDYDLCCTLAEGLPNSTIMNHDMMDLKILHAAGVGEADFFIACTAHDDANFLVGLLGKEVGCKEALVLLNNIDHIPIAARLGLAHIVSPRVAATDRILSKLFAGKVTTLVSLYENQAEVLEINVSVNSRVAGIPLSELRPLLPKDLLIIMIQNRGRVMIPHGSRIISPGDTVIVISSPKHIVELEKIF